MLPRRACELHSTDGWVNDYLDNYFSRLALSVLNIDYEYLRIYYQMIIIRLERL